MRKTITILTIFILSNSLISLKSHSQIMKDSTYGTVYNPIVKYQESNSLNLFEPLSILKSRVPGITFNKKGSDPNQFNSINIRGKETGFSSQVLYIIDGIMGADPLMLLPDDIESIEIIKDGAQLTAYGTQGSSGVVIIKTRHYTGDKKISVNFSSFVTFNSLAKKIDILSAEQLRSTVAKYDMSFIDGGSSTDWQEEIMRNDVSQIYNLGISGKLNNTVYDFSGFFDKNPGIVKGSSEKNNGVNLKVSHNIGDDIKLYTNLAYSSKDAEILPNLLQYGVNEFFLQTLRRNPTDPVYESDGVTFHQVEREFRYFNPLQIIDAINSTATTNNLRINAGGTYKIMKGLDAGINVGYSNMDYNYDYLQPAEALNNHYTEAKSNTSILNNRSNFEANIDYMTVLNKDHNISLGFLFRYRDLKHESERYTVNGSFKDTSIYNENRNYSNILMTAGYNFRQRYFLNAMANIESSELVVSGFQTSIDQVNRSHFYPSVIAGWKISNENFLKGNTYISNLLLRATYGIRGNSSADINMFKGYFPDIESLKTEKLTELNFAFDLGILKDKITGSLGWYNRNIDNGVGMFYLPMPPYTYPYTFRNVNSISSSGFEALISVKAINQEIFKWNSQFNFFKFTDELKEGNFINKEGNPTGYFNYSIENYPTQLLRSGSPSHVFYLPISAGYSEDGRPLYYTETGEKTRELSRAKYEIMSQTDPDFFVGWFNTFNIAKSFDLSVSMSYAGGYSIYNATRMYLSNPDLLPNLNISEEGLENLEAGYKYSAPLSETYLENASYLRVDNMTVSYTYTCNKMKNSGQLKIYASAGNLLTITDYSGYDPAGSGDGVDYFNVYPLARTYTLGLRLNL